MGVVATPQYLILGLDGRSDLKNFFMDRCPKDEATAKILFRIEALPRKTGKTCWGCGIYPLGHRRASKWLKRMINKNDS